MKPINKRAFILAMLPALQIASSTASENPGASINNLIITKVKGSELQLEARQMPLPKILDNLTLKTHIPIHYAVLPDGLVTATCIGTNLKPLLECLLAKKADLVFRNSQKPGHTDEIEEAWIMGSTLASYSGQNKNCSAATAKPNGELQAVEKQESGADRVDELLTLSKSKNPDDRAGAMAALLADDHKDDPAIKAALENALTDPNPSVRAQAVSTLAQVEGDNITPLLQDALHDESVDVRLTAVGGVTADNMALLEQAVNDSDETVRILAATRLEELRENGENR